MEGLSQEPETFMRHKDGRFITRTRDLYET